MTHRSRGSFALITLTSDTAGVGYSAEDVLARYLREMQSLQTRLTRLQREERIALTACVCLLAAGCVAVWLAWPLVAVALSAVLLTLIGTLAWLRRYSSLRKQASNAARLSDFYARGKQRMEGHWQGHGSTGHEFARKAHPYQIDLNILGDGSLFELLCTTRSAAGAERLASYLLDRADVPQIRHRQLAVQELRDATGLRESQALAGQFAFQECDSGVLHAWSRRPILEVHGIVSVLLLFCSGCCLSLGLLALIGVLTWHQTLPFLLPPFFVQTFISAALAKHVRPRLAALPALVNEFAVLRDGVALMQSYAFQSEKLNGLAEIVRNAAILLRSLERLVRTSEQRRKEFFYGFCVLLGVGTQLTLAIERWRKQHRKSLELWLDAWAEFDTLNALACYAYEHPENVFAEIAENAALFHAEALGHPLLPAHACVGNDVQLDEETPFYLVSGSNMAGKSTLLRAIGINAVLAAAGTSVRAARAQISLFTVCASIGIGDSLTDGKSKFLAEVERLQQTVHFAEQDGPVLFLIDEILSGTNSTDRRTIAEALVDALRSAGAVGAISTHDNALVAVANIARLRGINVHMGSRHPDAPLDFDYRIKPGNSQQSNALAIARMIGVPIPAPPAKSEVTLGLLPERFS